MFLGKSGPEREHKTIKGTSGPGSFRSAFSLFFCGGSFPFGFGGTLVILGSFFGGGFPWHLLGSWVGVMWSCCALRFGIRGPMECLLGVSCRGLKRYKNKGFALFGWEEGWPKGGPGSVQEGLGWA